MNKLDVLHLAAATTIVLSTSLGGAMPVQAQALSIRQLDEISEFVKCQTYLLKGDLASFEGDSDCGHGPVAPELKSLASSQGSGTPERDCYPYPTDMVLTFSSVGENCYPEYPEYPEYPGRIE